MFIEETVVAIGVPTPATVGSRSIGQRPEALRKARAGNGWTPLRPIGPSLRNVDPMPARWIVHGCNNPAVMIGSDQALATTNSDRVLAIWIGRPRHVRAVT
jgi:hypothetical protein